MAAFVELSGNWPEHPVVHEIFAWVWLEELERGAGRPLTLADVPADVWDDVARPGIDAVWLMGVWQRSPLGAAIARTEPSMVEAQRAALADVIDADVVGSAYCIRDYVVDERLGGDEALAVARAALAARGVRLVLDFVPNHVAPDHPWVTTHPELFVHGTREDLARDPSSFLEVGEHVFARGRDPYFPAWPEVLQLDASSESLRAAAADVLVGLTGRCDGAALRHGDARPRRRLPPHVGRPGVGRGRAGWRPWLLADGDRRGPRHPSGLRVLGGGLLGSRTGAARAGFRCLLRQAAVRPPRPSCAGERGACPRRR